MSVVIIQPAIAPDGDVIRFCDFCRWPRHKSLFERMDAMSCRWCRAAWAAKRDHGLRNGLYAVEEIPHILSCIDPPSPWEEGDVWMEEYSPPQTAAETNEMIYKDREGFEEGVPAPVRIGPTHGNPLWLPARMKQTTPLGGS